MSLRTIPEKDWDRLTGVLTAAYAFTIWLVLRPSDALALLGSEAMFAGPMIVAYFLSAWLARAKPRKILFGFVVAYTVLSAIVFYETFGFEHDAQYQLMLLLIPMLGYPSVVIAGLIAANMR